MQKYNYKKKCFKEKLNFKENYYIPLIRIFISNRDMLSNNQFFFIKQDFPRDKRTILLQYYSYAGIVSILFIHILLVFLLLDMCGMVYLAHNHQFELLKLLAYFKFFLKHRWKFHFGILIQNGHVVISVLLASF